MQMNHQVNRKGPSTKKVHLLKRRLIDDFTHAVAGRPIAGVAPGLRRLAARAVVHSGTSRCGSCGNCPHHLRHWRHGRLGVIAAGSPQRGFAQGLGRRLLGLRLCPGGLSNFARCEVSTRLAGRSPVVEAYTIEWQVVIDLSPSEVDECRQKIHRRHRLLDLLGRNVGSVDDHGNTRAVLVPAQKLGSCLYVFPPFFPSISSWSLCSLLELPTKRWAYYDQDRGVSISSSAGLGHQPYSWIRLWRPPSRHAC